MSLRIDRDEADVVIVGAGAAGLMTAICAARGCAERGVSARIALVDGARKIGAKILVAGGGRCNVTHEKVLPHDYAGSSRNTIKKALKAFSERDTIAFFSGLGVELRREETGKLFPVSNSAKTVLSALLNECSRLGIELRHPWRVKSVEPSDGGFLIRPSQADQEPLHASNLVIATGGMALPRTGSDGAGYGFVRSLGHRVTQRVLPALVPIVVGERSGWITELSGIATRASIEVRTGSNKRLARFTNDLLCTHFGLSGPAALDISRWYFDARLDDPRAMLIVNWIGAGSFEELDQQLISIGKKTLAGHLAQLIPDRLGRALCERAGVDPAAPGHAVTREQRRRLVHELVECEIHVERDRGFTFAEVTAGGVPLDEIQIATMQSKVRERLWIVGEILDVDGRIGGFNFQWAWSNGFVAGGSIADTLARQAQS